MPPEKKTALELHPAKANCSQALAVAYAPRFGIPQETAFRMAMGLGRGVSGLHEICGTIIGVSVVLGMAFGDKPDGQKRVFALTKEFAKKFEAENGSIVCGQLLGLFPATTGKALSKRPCHDLVADACDFLDSVLPGPTSN
ncbi:MAG: C-GCAxxG-C-C family protein [Kiritimatiellia bacterium]